MDRWTMEQMQNTDDITFAIAILNERRSKLTRYSPLALKLAEAESTLHEIHDAALRFLAETSPKVKPTAGQVRGQMELAEEEPEPDRCEGETDRELCIRCGAFNSCEMAAKYREDEQ